MANNKGLGRGLDSLFGSAEQEFDNAQTKSVKADVKAEAAADTQIPISKLFPNPEQPRKHFDQTALEELAESIRRHGIIQPVVVNQSGARYMIIAGERRYRAAQMAGLTEIPAIVKNYSETEIKEISLIENLQREDLNAIEAAFAVQRLMSEHRFTQEAVAGRVGKSRPYITNLLRLLELGTEVQNMVVEDRLSAGHARALVSVKNRAAQLKLAQEAADGKMSVRDLEKAVKQYGKPQTGKEGTTPSAFVQSLELKELKNLMQQVFATKVEIFGNDNKGKIYIDYYNRDDIDRIADIISGLKK